MKSFSIDAPEPLLVLAVVLVGLITSTAPCHADPKPPASTAHGNTKTPDSWPPGDDQEPCDEADLRRGEQVYREIGQATGGFVYGGPTKFLGQAMEIIVDATAPNVYNVVWRRGFVDGARLDPIPVRVDTTLKRVDFILNSRRSDSTTLVVHQPNGSPVKFGDSKAVLIDIPTLTRVRIELPVAGTWTMTVSGKGSYDVSAMGVTDIAFVDFSFTRRIIEFGRPVEEEVHNTLLLGEEVFFEPSVHGEVRDLAVELIHADGRRIETLTLEGGAEYGFYGRFTPRQPIDPFLVRVTGTDANGSPFERVLRRNFAIGTLIVRPHATATKVVGNQRSYRLEIRNAGPRGRFKISATTMIGSLPVSLSTDTIDLRTDGVEFVDAIVTIPDDPENDKDMLFVRVSSTRDETIKASAIVDVVTRRR